MTVATLTVDRRRPLLRTAAWFVQALAPIPLYSPRHTKVIAKWLLHALSASRFFLSQHVPHQLSNATTGLKYDPNHVLVR